MRTNLFVLILTLCLSQVAGAQSGDEWMLSQRDKDVVGIVEVRVGAIGSPLDRLEPERGTGAIISVSGHVLTAAHLFTDESYAICTSSVAAEPNKVCRIDFLWRGDPANRFTVTIASTRQTDRDYIVLRLPSAVEKIGRPGWPVATLAHQASDGEAVYATGYRASDPAQTGSANMIETARGTLRADMAGSCSNSYGIARNASMQTSPGLSGGPVFNRLHRLIGIVLGEACAIDGGSNIQDAPKSRILLVQDMNRLCDSPGWTCFFGFDGDIDPAPIGDASPWYTRLVGGELTADNYAYNIKIREIGKIVNLVTICPLMANDAQLVQSVQADTDKGGELATVFDSVWSVCKPGANEIDSLPNRQRLQRLAIAGYEPAQQFAAQLVFFELRAKLGSRRSPEDPLVISSSERVSLRRAESFLRSAAGHEWTAASMTMFDMCRTRVFSCTAKETEDYLEAALADGQHEALRSAGLLFLIGRDSVISPKIGFSRDQNIERALALFTQAATPQAGVTKNPNFMLYDNLAAGYLAYFYWGGQYRGRTLVNANPVLAQQYGMACNSVPQAVPQLFEFCGMIEAIGRFNNSSDRTVRQNAWNFVQQYTSWALTVGPLARNLASWTPDGTGIDQIDCPLSDELLFIGPATAPVFKPRTAYCYFPKPADD